MRRVRSFFKKLWRGIIHFFTHWTVKKVILTVIVVALLGLGASFAIPFLKVSSVVANAGGQSFTRTTVLKKDSITQSVTVTGTVESVGVSNVTSTANYKVTEILVQEGDTVTIGQTLCLLDTTDLLKQIEKENENIATTKKNAQTTYNDAAASYAEAVTNQTTAYDKAMAQETTYNNAQSALTTATNNFNTAKNSVSSAQNAYNTAYNADQAAGVALNSTSYNQIKASYDAAEVNLNNANATQATAQAAYDNAPDDQKDFYKAALDSAIANTQSAEANLASIKASLDSATATYQSAIIKKQETEAALNSATTALNNAKANCNYQTYETAYNSAVSTAQNARNTLDTLESTYKNAVKTTETALKTFQSAAEKLADAGTSDTLESLQEQLEACTITATSNGTITSVNATVGSAPGGGTSASTLFAIQDTNSLKVSVTIDEYDISNIKTGLQAVILSDATGDTEISGYVSQVSMTAATSQSAGSSTSSTGFGAEITVNGNDTGLLIGMSAKVEIILEQKEGVYSVPYDAVGKDDSGNDVVYVKQADGTFEPVQVTVGMETDYFIEISGNNLSDGMEVRNSADETSIDASASSQSSMQADMMMGGSMMGGSAMGGSAMPSGAAPTGGGSRGGM